MNKAEVMQYFQSVGEMVDPWQVPNGIRMIAQIETNFFKVHVELNPGQNPNHLNKIPVS